MSDMPVTIYADKWLHRSDGGIWFDEKVNHPAMPDTQYTRTDAAIEVLKARKNELNRNFLDYTPKKFKAYCQAIDDAIQALQSLGDK